MEGGEEEGEESRQVLMEGADSDSRSPKANGEMHLEVEVPETAHQISKGLLPLFFFIYSVWLLGKFILFIAYMNLVMFFFPW